MGAMSRGFRLLGASWEVLRADKELMVLPLVSMVALGAAAVPFILAAISVGVPSKGHLLPVHWVLLGLYFAVSYFIGIFFNAALVGAATIRLQGGDPTLGDGIRAATSRLGKIAGWAAMAATVGLALRALEQKFGWVGRIVFGLIGVAWAAVTFLVVPVLLFEELSVVDSVRRSANLFKQRWGEQFVGNASIGFAMLCLMLVPIAVALFVAAAVSPALGIALGIVSILGLIALGSALSAIFNAALYRFAVSGQPSGPFTADDLPGAFRPKRRRRKAFGG